ERARISTDVVEPEIKRGEMGRAAALGVLQILEALHSPLITTGKAQSILRAEGFTGSFSATSGSETAPRGWWLWLALGLVVFVLAGFSLTSADAHFTSGGWFRPRVWRASRWRALLDRTQGKRKNQELGGSHGSW